MTEAAHTTIIDRARSTAGAGSAVRRELLGWAWLAVGALAVAGVFAIGYSFSLVRLLLLAFFFCGGIELLQVPLPTRHARVSDFVLDFVVSCFAIGFVFASEKLFGVQNNRSRQK